MFSVLKTNDGTNKNSSSGSSITMEDNTVNDTAAELSYQQQPQQQPARRVGFVPAWLVPKGFVIVDPMSCMIGVYLYPKMLDGNLGNIMFCGVWWETLAT